MPMVTVDSSVLDQTTMLALIGVGAIITVLLLVIYLGYSKYRTPKEASQIKRASNRGQMALLLVGLDHFADIMPMNDLISEGIKESDPIGKGSKKTWFRFKLPRAESVGEVEVEAGKNKEVTSKVLQTLYDLNTEKVFLRKAKIPLLVGVKNSVAAVSLKFLGVQTFLGKLEALQKSGVLYKQIEILKTRPQFHELALWLEDMATKVSMIDFQQVYGRAASTVGQTDIDSLRERDQTIGRREGKEDKDKGTKNMLLYFGFAMGMVICLLVVAYFFLGMGQ